MTDYTEIYCRFDLLHEDTNQNLPLIYKLKLYEKYLHMAISYFYKDCNKDLNKRQDMYTYEYNFITDGIEKEFQLDPLPPENTLIYIAYKETKDSDFIEVDEFSYDADTGIITLPVIPKCNLDFYICTYVNGYFEDDLEEIEKDILAYGMLTSFNMKQLEKQTLLTHSVYSSSSKTFSKAEHINAVRNVYKNNMDTLKAMINEYTYKYDKNNLWNLTGRDYMYNKDWKTGIYGR